MTLSVVYFNNCDFESDPGAYGIRCCSDSLISGEIGKLTPHAMKILQLRISYDDIFCSIIKKQNIYHSIGFTYAGNLNVAMITYSLISYLCSHFQPCKGYYGTLPSIRNIAYLIAKSLMSYTWNFAELEEKNALTEIIIFGYCTEEKNFKTFHIYSEVKDKLYMKVDEIDLLKEQYIAIGSGRKLLEDQMRDKKSFNPDIVRKIIQNPESEKFGVGGFFQRGWSNKWGMQLYCDAMQNTSLGFGTPFCGFMISPLQIGNHIISLPMFADSV